MTLFGKSAILQRSTSDVQVGIPGGCFGTIKGHIELEPAMFLESIPKNECLIAPIPDMTFISHGSYNDDKLMEINNLPFTLKIRHNVTNVNHLKYIRVRHGDIHKGIPFQILPRKDTKEDGSDVQLPDSYWEADASNITITTLHFSQFLCISCKKTCDDTLVAFVTGNIKQCGQDDIADIKLFLCPSLYNIMDYKTVSWIFMWYVARVWQEA